MEPPPVPPGVLADEDDQLDASGVDYTEDPVHDDELAIVVLSPEGDPKKVLEYARLFGTVE
jgi:hypothetical protein